LFFGRRSNTTRATLTMRRPVRLRTICNRANEAGKGFRGFSEAVGLYEGCVALDPGYAPAWARLGRARWLVGKFSERASEKLVEGRSAIERALELNPDLPLAHKSVHEHPGGPRPRYGCDEASAQQAAQFRKPIRSCWRASPTRAATAAQASLERRPRFASRSPAPHRTGWGHASDVRQLPSTPWSRSKPKKRAGTGLLC